MNDGAQSELQDPGEPIREQPIGHRIMFWSLFGLGAAVFAPCVLLPEWYGYVTLRQVESIERIRNQGLNEDVARQQRLMDALRCDPAVNARIAQRELGYVAPNQAAVPIADPLIEPAPVRRPPEVPAIPPPAPVQQITRHLGDYDYRGLFCEKKTRIPLLILSGGLMAFAAGFYWRR